MKRTLLFAAAGLTIVTAPAAHASTWITYSGADTVYSQVKVISRNGHFVDVLDRFVIGGKLVTEHGKTVNCKYQQVAFQDINQR